MPCIAAQFYRQLSECLNPILSSKLKQANPLYKLLYHLVTQLSTTNRTASVTEPMTCHRSSSHLVCKSMSGSFKTDSMFFLVFSIFIFIPNEIHNYILASVLRPQNSDTESKSSQFPAKLKLHFTIASFCLTFPFLSEIFHGMLRGIPQISEFESYVIDSTENEEEILYDAWSYDSNYLFAKKNRQKRITQV